MKEAEKKYPDSLIALSKVPTDDVLIKNWNEKLKNKTKKFKLLLEKINKIVNSKNTKNKKLKEICKLLKDNISYYDWVGFYLVENQKNELVLGPFEGEPTEHDIIKFGSGICGQAAEKEETFIVQDVSKETNYLSCSINVKSEIVVPIIKDDTVVGELDIDSHSISPFTDEDKRFLEKVCDLVSREF